MLKALEVQEIKELYKDYFGRVVNPLPFGEYRKLKILKRAFDIKQHRKEEERKRSCRGV